MNSQGQWYLALTGLAFVVIGVVSFVMTGEPPAPGDDSAREIVAFYEDKSTVVGVASVLTCIAAALVSFYAVYVRSLMRAAQPDPNGDLAPMAYVVGAAILAAGLVLDASLNVALIDTAGDMSPAATEAISAVWTNDFPFFGTGLVIMNLALAVTILRHSLLPKWLGWVAVVLVVASPTPIGFGAFLGSLLFFAVTSVMFAVRGRRVS